MSLDVDTWVYLDTNVIISLTEALDGTWRPPPKPVARTDRQRLAAARLFLYGYRERWTNWYLATSSEARRELLREPSRQWLDAMFVEIDRSADQLPDDVLDAERRRFEKAGAKPADASHLAHAALRPWVRRFVTDDDQLRRAAERAGVPEHLLVSTSIEAEASLAIAAGEAPPITPLPTNPLAAARWWIPGCEYD